jgi:Tryptophan-rich sensory protein (mitochondrial benzodiazepine receptor homolog)
MKYILPLLVILTSIIGSLANTYISSDTWYADLIKSPLNPPSYVFSIVWPILYLMMAIVSFRVGDKFSSIFILQLALNAAWSWIFFFLHAPVIALIDIIFLIYLNQRILKKIIGESLILFYLYLPYLIWLTFAAFLNASIIWLN